MSRYLHFFILLIFAFSSYSQNNFKRGLFKSFEELRNNSPSDSLRYSIVPKTKTLGHSLRTMRDETYYRLLIGKKEAIQVGEIFGFSDGNTLYLTTGLVNPAKKTSLFNISERLNDSIYFFSHFYSEVGFGLYFNTSTGVGFIPTESKEQSYYVVNLNGSINQLTVDYMTELLKVDPDLAGEFGNERSKDGLLLLYLMKLLDDGQNF